MGAHKFLQKTHMEGIVQASARRQGKAECHLIDLLCDLIRPKEALAQLALCRIR